MKHLSLGLIATVLSTGLLHAETNAEMALRLKLEAALANAAATQEALDRAVREKAITQATMDRLLVNRSAAAAAEQSAVTVRARAAGSAENSAHDARDAAEVVRNTAADTAETAQGQAAEQTKATNTAALSAEAAAKAAANGVTAMIIFQASTLIALVLGYVNAHVRARGVVKETQRKELVAEKIEKQRQLDVKSAAGVAATQTVQLARIHTLVNSNLTKAQAKELVAIEITLVVFKELLVVRRKLGEEPSHEDIERVHEMETHITELREELTAGVLRTKEAEAQRQIDLATARVVIEDGEAATAQGGSEATEATQTAAREAAAIEHATVKAFKATDGTPAEQLTEAAEVAVSAALRTAKATERVAKVAHEVEKKS